MGNAAGLPAFEPSRKMKSREKMASSPCFFMSITAGGRCFQNRRSDLCNRRFKGDFQVVFDLCGDAQFAGGAVEDNGRVDGGFEYVFGAEHLRCVPCGNLLAARASAGSLLDFHDFSTALIAAMRSEKVVL